MKAVCFIHSCTLPQNGTSRLLSLLTRIKTAGLDTKLQFIYICNVGLEITRDRMPSLSCRVIINNYSDSPNTFEIPTLKIMHEWSHRQDAAILYLHTKGVSYSKRSSYLSVIESWIEVMLRALVDKWKDCVNLLKRVQVVGTFYRGQRRYRTGMKYQGRLEEIGPHFSGNFWWSRSDYVSTLQTRMLKTKHSAEAWIGSKNPTFADLYPCSANATHCYKGNPFDGNILQKQLFWYKVLLLRLLKVYYGSRNKFIDVTDEVMRNGKLYIAGGDQRQFPDPCPGQTKHVWITTRLSPITIMRESTSLILNDENGICFPVGKCV